MRGKHRWPRTRQDSPLYLHWSCAVHASTIRAMTAMRCRTLAGTQERAAKQLYLLDRKQSIPVRSGRQRVNCRQSVEPTSPTTVRGSSIGLAGHRCGALYGCMQRLAHDRQSSTPQVKRQCTTKSRLHSCFARAQSPRSLQSRVGCLEHVCHCHSPSGLAALHVSVKSRKAGRSLPKQQYPERLQMHARCLAAASSPAIRDRQAITASVRMYLILLSRFSKLLPSGRARHNAAAFWHLCGQSLLKLRQSRGPCSV